MTTVLLVRHASTAETGRKLTGWAEGVGLNDRGVGEAQATARALQGIGISALYSSPIQRARETAAAIAEVAGLPVEISEGVGEVRYGTWTNRSLKVLARTKLWGQVQAWPSSVRFPGGETLREVQARAVTAVDALAAEHSRQTICCVTHADVIKLVMAHYMGVHIDLFQRLAVAPASLSAVVLGGRAPRVLTLNWVPVLRAVAG